MDTTKCPACGQTDHGQTGEYPCSECGLPMTHDEETAGETPMTVTNLQRCARCGEDHDCLEFRPFTRQNEQATHWCMCPVTNEPIIAVASLGQPANVSTT